MDYHPDGDLYTPGLLYDVKEFAPNNNRAYQRIPSVRRLTSSALTTGPCIGSAVIRTSAGATKMFAGSATKIYQADGSGGWTDRSGGVTFAATSWDFQAFGDFSLAANGASKVQVATTGNFADITDAPAGAKILVVHANAVVAFNTTANNSAWHRSASADHTTWTATTANDADSGTLYGGVGGPITAATTYGNLLIAWKSRAMFAGLYSGNGDPDQPVIRWQTIAQDVGCVAKDAWIATEAGIVFVSERDILLFNGGKPISIADKIRKTFLEVARTNKTRIFLTLDEANNHVYVWISPDGATYCSKAYVWNYKTEQWGRLDAVDDVNATLLGDARTPVRNVTHEDLVAIGGFVTGAGTANRILTANCYFDVTQDYLINLCGITYGNAAFMRTGRMGRVGEDTILHKVHVVTDGFSALGIVPTANAFAYQADLAQSKTIPATYSTNNGTLDTGSARARAFELQVTYPAGIANISRLAAEMQDAQQAKAVYTVG